MTEGTTCRHYLTKVCYKGLEDVNIMSHDSCEGPGILVSSFLLTVRDLTCPCDTALVRDGKANSALRLRNQKQSVQMKACRSLTHTIRG